MWSGLHLGHNKRQTCLGSWHTDIVHSASLLHISEPLLILPVCHFQSSFGGCFSPHWRLCVFGVTSAGCPRLQQPEWWIEIFSRHTAVWNVMLTVVPVYTFFILNHMGSIEFEIWFLTNWWMQLALTEVINMSLLTFFTSPRYMTWVEHSRVL